MKYTFEVTNHDGEDVIKIDIAYGAISNNVIRTVKFVRGAEYDQSTLNEIISEMVDNLRLTVKEREDAIYNAKTLLWYVQQYGVNDNKDPQTEEQMIVENGDPGVLYPTISSQSK